MLMLLVLRMLVVVLWRCGGVRRRGVAAGAGAGVVGWFARAFGSTHGLLLLGFYFSLALEREFMLALVLAHLGLLVLLGGHVLLDCQTLSLEVAE